VELGLNRCGASLGISPSFLLCCQLWFAVKGHIGQSVSRGDSGEGSEVDCSTLIVAGALEQFAQIAVLVAVDPGHGFLLTRIALIATTVPKSIFPGGRGVKWKPREILKLTRPVGTRVTFLICCPCDAARRVPAKMIPPSSNRALQWPTACYTCVL
jgi:hypothetical protein